MILRITVSLYLRVLDEIECANGPCRHAAQSDMGKSLYRMACGTHAGIRAIAVLITATEQTYQSLPYLHEITHAIQVCHIPDEFDGNPMLSDFAR